DRGISNQTSVRNASFEDSLPPGVTASSDSTDQARSARHRKIQERSVTNTHGPRQMASSLLLD
ncbi:MAG: hypothetical protein Q8O58_06445, partial [Gallionella sp.]|nr:hypothetical protein [Gallionella sp.]